MTGNAFVLEISVLGRLSIDRRMFQPGKEVMPLLEELTAADAAMGPGGGGRLSD